MASVNTRLQLACVWAGPAFIVTYILFFWVIANFIPPPAPTMSAEKLSAFYDANRTEIRIGQLGALVSSTLLFPFWAVITAQILRIERTLSGTGGRPPVLALIQISGAILLQVFFAICSMLWIAATYRPELGAETVRVLHDTAWLMFVMVFPAYVMQMVSIGIAAFIDRSPDPIWPRWAGYLNLWVGVAGMGGGLAVFFKDGAFAWNGLIGFYVPIAVFAIWMLIMTYLMHTGIKRQAREDEIASAAEDPQAIPA